MNFKLHWNYIFCLLTQNMYLLTYISDNVFYICYLLLFILFTNNKYNILRITYIGNNRRAKIIRFILKKTYKTYIEKKYPFAISFSEKPIKINFIINILFTSCWLYRHKSNYPPPKYDYLLPFDQRYYYSRGQFNAIICQYQNNLYGLLLTFFVLLFFFN